MRLSEIQDIPDRAKRREALDAFLKEGASETDLAPQDFAAIVGTKIGTTVDPTNYDTSLDTLVDRIESIPEPIDMAVHRTAAGTADVTLTAASPLKPKPRIMLVETYTLTSFYEDYGVGRTLNTFTLLPGEKTKISIKTWKTTETSAKQASSVLDSWTRDQNDTLEKSIQHENTNSQETKESLEWYVDAEVKGHYNTLVAGVEASVKGGAKGNTNTARQSLSKNVSSATEKHVASVSAKRNIEVNTTFETKTVTGEEQSIVRDLENVNAGRVLNFVFRQLNQQFSTYLLLTDVKLAITDGFKPPTIGLNPHYREYSLAQIEEFLDFCIRDPKGGETVNPKGEVRRMIVEELASIADYNGDFHQFIECIDIATGKPSAGGLLGYLNNPDRKKYYLRSRRDPFHPKENHQIPGIIVDKKIYVLPTDSVIIEALLGQAEALDKYSMDSRQAVIDMKKAEIEKMNLAHKIIESKDTQKADLFAKVYPAPAKIDKET